MQSLCARLCNHPYVSFYKQQENVCKKKDSFPSAEMPKQHSIVCCVVFFLHISYACFPQWMLENGPQ